MLACSGAAPDRPWSCSAGCGCLQPPSLLARCPQGRPAARALLLAPDLHRNRPAQLQRPKPAGEAGRRLLHTIYYKSSAQWCSCMIHALACRRGCATRSPAVAVHCTWHACSLPARACSAGGRARGAGGGRSGIISFCWRSWSAGAARHCSGRKGAFGRPITPPVRLVGRVHHWRCKLMLAETLLHRQ